jgi:hypothetical protein
MPFSVHSHVIKRLGCTYPLTSSHRRHPVPDSGRDRAQETFASVAGSGANLPTRFRFLFPFFSAAAAAAISLSLRPGREQQRGDAPIQSRPLAAIRRIPQSKPADWARRLRKGVIFYPPPFFWSRVPP